jgi:hypothetical protein
MGMTHLLDRPEWAIDLGTANTLVARNREVLTEDRIVREPIPKEEYPEGTPEGEVLTREVTKNLPVQIPTFIAYSGKGHSKMVESFGQAAKNLHGRLLIVHGMMDDNVHMQNSVQLADALQRAGKEFEMMFYPQSRHGIGSQHYMKLQIEFIRRTMGGK